MNELTTIHRTVCVSILLLLGLAPLVRGDDASPAAKTDSIPVAPPAAVPSAPPQAEPSGVTPLIPPTALSEADSDRINASARGLAGLIDSYEGATWQSTPEWKDYSTQIGNQWSYMQRIRLTAMRAWSASELGSLRDKTTTVFYPFSGPDVLYADTLFPNSKVLLMAGLEPVGTMPDLAKVQADGKLAPYLAQMKTSLFTILAASFFKTKDMKNDFNNQLVDGLMPAMVVFLAHSGYTITAIDYVSLDHDGMVHPRGEHGLPGVQITYGDGRTMLYFQVDLGNDGQKNNPGYVKLMQRLSPGVTYLKAASYLLYEDYFSTIREAILNDSLGVVEDDSGIPLHDFKLSAWNVIPYGNYTGPIGLFKDKNQPDLLDFYTKTPHQQLSFGSGYKFTPSSSSLLIVTKKS